MFKEFTVGAAAGIMKGKTAIDGLELIRDVSIDSRSTKPGDLFFALKGENTDGHIFAKNAENNGAFGVVVHRETGCDREIIVSDTLNALGEFARVYRNHFDIKIIGITGTNGKTTVKNLIVAIMKTKYRVFGNKQNFNSLIGLPLTIFNISGAEDYMVAEMGTSSPGEIRMLCNIGQPFYAVLTNVGPGHLTGLGSIDEVKREKLSLIESLPSHGFGVVNENIGDIKTKKIIYRFSENMLDDVQLNDAGSWFSFMGERFYTPLLGAGNVSNCLAALVLTSRLGVDVELQKSALRKMQPEPARLEPIRHNGLLIINDTYNANPVSMRLAIDLAKSIKRQRVFIFGDMLELGKNSKNYHVEIGEYAREYCDTLLTYGDEAQNFKGKHFTDKNKLVGFLMKNLSGDELILVKASRALKFEEIVNDILRRC